MLRLLKCCQVVLSLQAAFLIATAVVGIEAHAAPGWTSQPAWAANTGEAPAARKPAYRENAYNVAPFTPGSNNVSLDIGQVFLMGDLSSTYSDSIGSQVHYTYGVSDMFGFDSSFGYSSHSDGKFSMTTLLTGLRMNLSWYDKVIPYVNFGLGFYKPSYELSPIESVSPVIFGLHLGPGVNLEITKQIFFGASLTFHDMFGTKKTVAKNNVVDVDGTFTSFFLNAGVTF